MSYKYFHYIYLISAIFFIGYFATDGSQASNKKHFFINKLLIKYDYYLHHWISAHSTALQLQINKRKYTSYNNILFYEAIAKSSGDTNARIYHIAVTKNNGKMILLKNVTSQEEFAEADKVFVAKLNSFKFSQAYEPNGHVEKHIKRQWYNFTIKSPTSWKLDGTAKTLRFTIPNAKIEVYHAATMEEAQKHVVTLKQILQKVDITKDLGKLQQIRTKQGWETILMLSPKMQTDATTWMRAEYVLAQVIKGLAAQSANKTAKIQNNIKASPQQQLAYQKAVKARQEAIALAKAKQKQGQFKFLAAIDKRNKSVISDMNKRLKAMTKITKRFEGDIKGLNAKAKKAQNARKRAALRKKQVSTGMVAASGGFGRWGSDKQPIYVRPDYPKTQPASLAECKLSPYTYLSVEKNCIPTQ